VRLDSDPQGILRSGLEWNRTRRLSLIAVLAALYVASNVIPVSVFIGGAGFITAGILLLPVVAGLLRPTDAAGAAIASALGLFAFQLSYIPIFGFYGLVIPAAGMILGALGFRKSPLIPATYVALGAAWYISFSHGTLLWLLPYGGAIALSVGSALRMFGSSGKLLTHCVNATTCELVTINISSISLLLLPGELWLFITPFMLFERALAVAGSYLILLTLARTNISTRLTTP
jgi:hypothetical protein